MGGRVGGIHTGELALQRHQHGRVAAVSSDGEGVGGGHRKGLLEQVLENDEVANDDGEVDHTDELRVIAVPGGAGAAAIVAELSIRRGLQTVEAAQGLFEASPAEKMNHRLVPIQEREKQKRQVASFKPGV